MPNLLPFVKELIAIPSDPDNLEALDVILRSALSRVEGYTIERFTHNGVKSALVYNQKERPERFKVLLNAHLDVIPAKKEQYEPKVKGDKLYGAGSMDMKSGAACLIEAFTEVANDVPYALALQLTTDEEVGGFDGTKHQIEQGVRAEFVLAGEPTNLEIVHKAKGILQVKVHAVGETAHGAYPWRGDNAVWKLHDFLSRLKARFPVPDHEVWQTTVNLAGIETANRALNKVPDHATALLDIRYISEDAASIREQVEACLPEGCSMEVVFFEPAMHTATDNEFVQKLNRSAQKLTGQATVLRGANGSSDARHFAGVGGAGVEFGPVGGGIGSDEEWVDIVSLETYGATIQDFLRSL